MSDKSSMGSAQRPALVGAVDASSEARLVLERLGEEAARHQVADVHVVRVIDVAQKYADRVPIEDEHDALRVEAKDVLDAFRPSGRVHIHVRVGRPDEEIIALAHEARADMIVIGHHGEGHRHDLHRRRFAGNTVERVLRVAPCPVLVVQDRLYDPPPADQCADCVRVRAETAGETWFCDAHRSRERPLHDVTPADPYSIHSVGFGSGGVF